MMAGMRFKARVRCSLFLALVGLAAGCAKTPSPAGQWKGTAALPDQDSVTAVVDIAKVGTRWVGQFDLPFHGLEDYPLEISVSGPQVHLFFAGPEADFQGTLSGDGKALSGTATLSDGMKVPLTFRRVGEAQLSEMFWKLERAADDSSLVSRLSVDGAELRAQFNADRDKTRLLMLLSPT
jgi:hypothetical protein